MITFTDKHPSPEEVRAAVKVLASARRYDPDTIGLLCSLAIEICRDNPSETVACQDRIAEVVNRASGYTINVWAI